MIGWCKWHLLFDVNVDTSTDDAASGPLLAELKDYEVGEEEIPLRYRSSLYEIILAEQPDISEIIAPHYYKKLDGEIYSVVEFYKEDNTDIPHRMMGYQLKCMSWLLMLGFLGAGAISLVMLKKATKV